MFVEDGADVDAEEFAGALECEWVAACEDFVHVGEGVCDIVLGFCVLIAYFVEDAECGDGFFAYTPIVAVCGHGEATCDGVEGIGFQIGEFFACFGVGDEVGAVACVVEHEPLEDGESGGD